MSNWNVKNEEGKAIALGYERTKDGEALVRPVSIEERFEFLPGEYTCDFWWHYEPNLHDAPHQIELYLRSKTLTADDIPVFEKLVRDLEGNL